MVDVGDLWPDGKQIGPTAYCGPVVLVLFGSWIDQGDTAEVTLHRAFGRVVTPTQCENIVGAPFDDDGFPPTFDVTGLSDDEIANSNVSPGSR
jgi:hypothetical protein